MVFMMELSEGEKKILNIIAKRNLITKTELIHEMENNGDKNARGVVESVTLSLLEKGHLMCLNPIGSTCFVITKSGQQIIGK